MKLFAALVLLFFLVPVSGQSYSISSPDNSIKVEITASPSVTFRVLADGKELMSRKKSNMAVKIASRSLPRKPLLIPPLPHRLQMQNCFNLLLESKIMTNPHSVIRLFIEKLTLVKGISIFCCRPFVRFLLINIYNQFKEHEKKSRGGLNVKQNGISAK